MTWTVFDSPLARCNACRLCDSSAVHALRGEGNPNADLMLIGEAPGADEEYYARPFVGAAGELLNSCLAEVGLVRSELFIRNAVSCLDGTAKVRLADGRIERIAKLVKDRYAGAVESIDEHGSLVHARVMGHYRTPLADRRIVRLSYENARRNNGGLAGVNLTDDHEVRTRRGWVAVRDLRIGDEIATGERGVTERAAEILTGSLLGDGHIVRMKHVGRPSFQVCSVVEEHARLRARALTSLGGHTYVLTRRAPWRTQYRYSSDHLAALVEWRRRWYAGPRDRKIVPRDLVLTPRALAVWWMDDGSLRQRSGRRPVGEIATCGFTLRDVWVLEQKLDALEIEAITRDTKVGPRLYITAYGVRHLAKIIGPYVPPSMRYKLPDDAPPYDASLWDEEAAETHWALPLILESTAHAKNKSVYCLDVEGTHNFVTTGGVVHNCRPTTSYGKNRKPTAHEIDCCRDYSIDDIKRVRPKVILVLGDTPATSLLGKLLGGVTDNRGRARWVDDLNAWVVVTFHPAYALRVPAQRHFIVEDLRTAKAIVEHGAPLVGSPTDVQYIETLDDAFAMKDEILSGRYSDLAWDTETNGTHLTKSRAFMYSFSVRERHAWAVPRFWQDWIPAWSPRDARVLDREVLAPILLSDLEKDGFFVAFDMSITESTLGIVPRNVTGCWMTAHHLLNNHLGERAHALKICAALYSDMGRYDDALDQWLVDHGYTIDGKPDMGQVWRAPQHHTFVDGVCVECGVGEFEQPAASTLPSRRVVLDDATSLSARSTRPCLVPYYAGQDSDATRRLKYVLKPRLIAAGLWPVFVKERMPLVLDYRVMDRIGVRINAPYLDTLSSRLDSALTQLEQEIVECVDPAILSDFPGGINPASAKQVAKLLFDNLDLPIIARTETHQPATGEEYLVQLKELHPVVDKILRHRTFAKIKGTWVDGRRSEKGQKKALRAVLDEDGYARMATRLAGPETFRFATRKPFSIHTFPKNSKDYPSVRSLVIPDEGYSFLQRDFSQQELVIMMILAGQWDVVDRMLEDGEDIHEIVTHELGGAPKSNYLLSGLLDVPTVANIRACLAQQQSETLARILAHAGHLDLNPFDFDDQVWRSEAHYTTYKKARQKWKGVSFMILFLGGARKLARMALDCRCVRDAGEYSYHTRGGELCSHESDAQRAIQEYYERYPQVKWWQYCLAPHTRVLRADLTWGRADKMKVGEQIIGFDEKLGRHNRFRRARVTGIQRIVRPCYRVETDRGVVVASAEHLWVARQLSGERDRAWVATSDLRIGDRVCFLAEPWGTDFTRDGGYLSGFFDGEGSCDRNTVMWSQNPGRVSRRVRHLLRERGFKFKQRANPSLHCQQFWITSREEVLRFLGSIRPERLLAKSRRTWEGRQTWSRKTPAARITRISYLGECETVALATSTRTLVAEGFLSHNSKKKELRENGLVTEIFGTRRILPGIHDPNKWTQLEAERMGCNFPIQRGGNALLVRALLGVNREFRGKPPLRAPFPGRLVFTVHDELIAQVRDDMVEEGEYIMRKHMERPHKELGGRGLRTTGEVTKAWV